MQRYYASFDTGLSRLDSTRLSHYSQKNVDSAG
jgi:hypothetical protein